MNKFSKQKKINILVTWHVMSDYIKKNKKDLQKKIKFNFFSYDQYLKEKDLIPIIDKYDGIICGDDWREDSVKKAVRKFSEENNLKIYSSGNFWKLY